MNRSLRAPYVLAALAAVLAASACGRSPAGVEGESGPAARLSVAADSTAAPELTEGGPSDGTAPSDPGAPPPSEERGGGYGVGSGH